MATEGKNLVGVDIGTSSIKLCEVREDRRNTRTLARFGYHPLPSQTIVDGHIMNAGAIVEGLERLFFRVRRRDVALRVGGHSVIIKKITMPTMTAAELSEQINWEAEQHIPFELTDVQIDYQVVSRREDQGQMDVLLVAAKNEEITDLINLALEAKLRPRVVDLDAFTVQNCYEMAYGPPSRHETVVLLHVGAALTTLNILAQGTTAFTRDVVNGGNTITEEIQRQLGVGEAEAEAYKCGSTPHAIPAEVSQIVHDCVESLAGEIQRSLDFYLATSGDREIHRVLLSGGTSNLRALHEEIASRCQVEVTSMDPLRVARPDPNTVDPVALQGRTAQAVVAYGLSLRKERERRA